MGGGTSHELFWLLFTKYNWWVSKLCSDLDFVWIWRGTKGNLGQNSPAQPHQTSSCPAPDGSGTRTPPKFHRNSDALFPRLHPPVKWIHRTTINPPQFYLQNEKKKASTNLLKLTVLLLGRNTQMFFQLGVIFFTFLLELLPLFLQDCLEN